MGQNDNPTPKTRSVWRFALVLILVAAIIAVIFLLIPRLRCPPLCTGFDLTGKNFRSKRLDNINFSNSVLDGVDFTSATLNHANFSTADLTGADFSGASLVEADFSGADLHGSKFIGNL